MEPRSEAKRQLGGHSLSLATQDGRKAVAVRWDSRVTLVPDGYVVNLPNKPKR